MKRTLGELANPIRDAWIGRGEIHRHMTRADQQNTCHMAKKNWELRQLWRFKLISRLARLLIGSSHHFLRRDYISTIPGSPKLTEFQDMCQIQAPISFREFKKIVWERAIRNSAS